MSTSSVSNDRRVHVRGSGEYRQPALRGNDLANRTERLAGLIRRLFQPLG